MLFGSKVLWPAPRFESRRFYGYRSICIKNLIVFLWCLYCNLQNQVKLKGLRLKLNPTLFTMTRFVFETAKVKKKHFMTKQLVFRNWKEVKDILSPPPSQIKNFKKVFFPFEFELKINWNLCEVSFLIFIYQHKQSFLFSPAKKWLR